MSGLMLFVVDTNTAQALRRGQPGRGAGEELAQVFKSHGLKPQFFDRMIGVNKTRHPQYGWMSVNCESATEAALLAPQLLGRPEVKEVTLESGQFTAHLRQQYAHEWRRLRFM